MFNVTRQLFNAIDDRNYNEISSLISKGCDINDNEICDFTPLMRAINNDDIKMIDFLILHGADPDRKNRDEENPIHLAYKNSYWHIVLKLLSLGTDCSSLNWNPLMIACVKGQIDIVKKELNKFSYNAIDANGNTPLILAVIYENIEIIDLLLQYKSVIDVFNFDLKTPLYIAVASMNYEIVKTLLEAGASPDVPRRSATLPLVEAIKLNNYDIINELIFHDANLNVITNDGKSPILIAVQYNNLSVVKLLLSEGANPNTMTTHSWTPLMWAACYSNQEMVNELLAKNADISVKNDKGKTVIDVAIAAGCYDLANFLFQELEKVKEKNRIKNNYEKFHRTISVDSLADLTFSEAM